MFNRFVSSVLVFCVLFMGIGQAFAEGNYIIVPKESKFVGAEERLKGLSVKAKDARIQSGVLDIGLGALYIGLGSSYSNYNSSYYSSSSNSSFASVYYLFGAGAMLLGAYSLIFPTELEKNYQEVKDVSGATILGRQLRETKAEKFLKAGSENAEKTRTITSWCFTGGGVVLATVSPIVGALMAGIGIAGFFMPSDIEKNYAEYVEEKENYLEAKKNEEELKNSSSNIESPSLVPSGEVNSEGN